MKSVNTFSFRKLSMLAFCNSSYSLLNLGFFCLNPLWPPSLPFDLLRKGRGFSLTCISDREMLKALNLPDYINLTSS